MALTIKEEIDALKREIEQLKTTILFQNKRINRNRKRMKRKDDYRSRVQIRQS